MLNLNEINAIGKEVVEMNEIVVNGLKTYKLNDDDLKKVIGYINSLGATSSVAYQPKVDEKQVEKAVEVKEDRPLNTAKTTGLNDVTCKWAVEEVFDENNKKFYRIVDGIWTAGKWMDSKYDANKQYRIPCNQEAHRLATEALKKVDNIQNVKMNGGWFAYGFKAKKTAEATITKLPAKISKVAIADYIAEHGQIKAKAVTRVKPQQ